MQLSIQNSQPSRLTFDNLDLNNQALIKGLDADVTYQGRLYKVRNGTFYHGQTSEEIIRILERCRRNETLIRLDLGDAQTGESWSEEFDVQGRLGRSMGPMKVPLLICDDECGGPQLLDHCIVAITYVESGRTAYRHPSYRPKYDWRTGHVILNPDSACPGYAFGLYAPLKTSKDISNALVHVASFDSFKSRYSWLIDQLNAIENGGEVDSDFDLAKAVLPIAQDEPYIDNLFQVHAPLTTSGVLEHVASFSSHQAAVQWLADKRKFEPMPNGSGKA